MADDNPYAPPSDAGTAEGPQLGGSVSAGSGLPKRVLLVGLLFCLGGAFAIWDIVEDLTRSTINFNLSVLLLPVGIGLLRGKTSSLGWAKFWIVLGWLVCGLGIVLVFIFPQKAYVTWFDNKIQGPEAVPLVVGVALAVILALLVMYILLASDKSKAYFRRHRN